MKKVLFFITLSIVFFTSCEKEGFESNDHDVYDQVESSTRSESECAPSSGFPSLWISNILYNDYDNGPGDDFENMSGASTYSDFTNLCIPVNPSSSNHVLFIEGSTIPFIFSVWLDLNQDGDFDDSGEQLANNVNASGSGGVVPLTGESILSGNSALRIIESPYTIGGPCDDIEVGEVEDYTVCVIYECAWIQEVSLYNHPFSNVSEDSQPSNYSDYTALCIPLFNSPYGQINVVANQGGVYMALYIDMNNNGVFDNSDKVVNGYFPDGDLGIGLLEQIASGLIASGQKVRVIVSDLIITDPNDIPECGEVEDYILCDGEVNCETGTPTNLNVDCVKDAYIWDHVPGSSGDYEVQFNLNVYIFCCGSGPTTPQVVTRTVMGSNELSFDDANLPSFKNGTWRVRAICGDGTYSQWSNTVPILFCVNPGGGIGDD